MSIPERDGRALVLFDGVCNLCNAAVNFIIARDPDGQFAFGALQSEAGASLLARHGLRAGALDSIVLIEGGRAYRRSEAALRIAWHLGGGWRLLYPLVWLPRPLRDAAYDYLAAHRYRWFGQREACRVPTPELRARFVG